MTTVTFELHLYTADDIEEVSEAALQADPGAYQDLLSGQDSLDGAIRIDVPGQPTLTIADDLSAAVQQLCFGAIPALLDERREQYVYRLISVDEHVVMMPMADQIRIFGEELPAITERAKVLLPRLYDCGLRCLHLMDQLGSAAVVEHLRPFAEAAADTLTRHGLLPTPQ